MELLKILKLSKHCMTFMKLFKKLILALLLVAFTTTSALGFTDLQTNWHIVQTGIVAGEPGT
jgi:hypothetical protein